MTGQRPPSSGSRLQTLFTSLSPHPTTYPTRTVFLQTNLDTRTFAPIYHTQQILGCSFETLHRNATWRGQWRDIQLASASFATRANFSYKESKKHFFFLKWRIRRRKRRRTSCEILSPLDLKTRFTVAPLGRELRRWRHTRSFHIRGSFSNKLESLC